MIGKNFKKTSKISSEQFRFDYLTLDKYTITAVDLYNPKLSLEKNKLSFFSESFIEAGGRNFLYIPCLNDEKIHIDMFFKIIKNELLGWI